MSTLNAVSAVMLNSAGKSKTVTIRGDRMAGISFRYTGSAMLLIAAINNATALLKSKAFREVIERREKLFFNTTRTCSEIARLIFESDAKIKLQMFSKRPRFGRITTAKVDPNVRDTIFFNTFALARGDRANTNTLIHETVHVIDKFHDKNSTFDFTHKGNNSRRPPQNQDSAPYWIGNRSEDLIPLIAGKMNANTKGRRLDRMDPVLLQKAITERDWAGKAHFCCGTS